MACLASGTCAGPARSLGMGGVLAVVAEIKERVAQVYVGGSVSLWRVSRLALCVRFQVATSY